MFESTKVISSFNQVELTTNKKLLVLCDIDGTVLHFPDCDRFCNELIKDFCPNGPNEPTYNEELANLKSMYYRIREPSHTDYEGFVSMIKKINETEGKIMFLTARHLDSDSWTKKQLKQIGINPEDFKIHYTGSKITKGEYIKEHINLDGWENIIFIDDYDSYIKSVTDLHPQIKCYKFEAILPSISSS